MGVVDASSVTDVAPTAFGESIRSKFPPPGESHSLTTLRPPPCGDASPCSSARRPTRCGVPPPWADPLSLSLLDWIMGASGWWTSGEEG